MRKGMGCGVSHSLPTMHLDIMLSRGMGRRCKWTLEGPCSHVLVMLLPLQDPDSYREGARTAAGCRRGLSLRACFTIRGRGEIAMVRYTGARGAQMGEII
jgi:hypothetical protein